MRFSIACLSVRMSVQTVNFEPVEFGTSYQLNRYIFTISLKLWVAKPELRKRKYQCHVIFYLKQTPVPSKIISLNAKAVGSLINRMWDFKLCTRGSKLCIPRLTTITSLSVRTLDPKVEEDV